MGLPLHLWPYTAYEVGARLQHRLFQEPAEEVVVAPVQVQGEFRVSSGRVKGELRCYGVMVSVGQ